MILAQLKVDWGSTQPGDTTLQRLMGGTKKCGTNNRSHFYVTNVKLSDCLVMRDPPRNAAKWMHSNEMFSVAVYTEWELEYFLIPYKAESSNKPACGNYLVSNCADTGLCVDLVIAMNNLIKLSSRHLLPSIDLSQMLEWGIRIKIRILLALF